MTELGIVGFGQFGQFTARHLASFFEVTVCDAADLRREAENIGVKWSDFANAVSKPLVIFAVPLAPFAEVLERAAPLLQPDAICFDVCSVKLKPLELMEKILPATVEIVGTHPLFGPQSGQNGIENLRIAVCPVRTTRTAAIKQFLGEKLKLAVIEKSPAEHDREMARVQVLTHFVARALDELHVADSELSTVSYLELMKAARLVSEDSWELFKTIQDGNPFAADKRRDFIDKLIELEARLSETGAQK